MTAITAHPLIRRLRISTTLSAYVARQYGAWLLIYFSGLVGIILLVSTVDLLDRLASMNASLGIVLRMVLLKLPYLSQEVMPFIVLFAGLSCFWRMTRSNELVITRAAGISVWQILLPMLGLATLIGIMTVTLLNPVASILLGRYEQMEAQYIRNESSTLAVSSAGLWLRQADANGQSVIHARRVTHDPLVLYDVIIFQFEDQDRFVGRIDAARAELEPGRWVLYEAWQTRPSSPADFAERIEVDSNLTPEKILDSFAPPEPISFWSLPEFIELLTEAGFSAVRHKLQFHRLLATPALLIAMVLLAATFSLRPQRRGNVALVILSGVLAGFLLYFLSNFVFALGLSARIPVVLAAWTPAGVCMMLGVATLLHLEDG
ncbi:MAG: LPS export ABC transporter permease LptG [Proteobacteria bacterium]|nr:LPS export ABC transporter permease LptG [Pseudomonadota bacterium]